MVVTGVGGFSSKLPFDEGLFKFKLSLITYNQTKLYRNKNQ